MASIVWIYVALVSIFSYSKYKRGISETGYLDLADPLNQAALIALVRLDLELINLAPLSENLRHLVAMRKPAVDTLRAANRKLGSDLFLFSSTREETLRLIEHALTIAQPISRPRG